MKMLSADLERLYPVCRSVMDEREWNAAARTLAGSPSSRLSDITDGSNCQPAYIKELALIEEACRSAEDSDIGDASPDDITVNPSLHMLELSWRGLASYIAEHAPADPLQQPEECAEIMLVWRPDAGGKTEVRPATDADLLALKVTVEEIDPVEAAAAAGLPVGAIDAAIDLAAAEGILLKPASRIRRRQEDYPISGETDPDSLFAESFTLQWHITQSCDLHCMHCYDRTDRDPMSLERGLAVLDDMRSFCRGRMVKGHVAFSGGNPLMYPYFIDLYGAAVDRGFGVGILGNPCPKMMLSEIKAIAEPSYYQVSLEGLRKHNDRIRGRGHFDRAVRFLDLLKDMGIYSMVMLTLTRDNMDQVIPLGMMLEGKTESFNFNRLSPVGEGASLALPEPADYAAFLEEYLDARKEHRHLRLKDNLFNVTLEKRGLAPFDGCTGHGCGAAFNFISVLADGEAHACRKFPSHIGNVYVSGFSGVYDSARAKGYRRGSTACDGCGLRAHCGGCMAIASGSGLDPFTGRDPFCLKERAS